MRVIINEGFTYIPVWNNNKKAEKEDQITVEFKFLSGADFSTIIDTEGKTDNEKEWLIVCKGVKNLFINDKEIAPLDVFKLPGLVDLYVELKLAYRNETVIDKKK